MYCCMRTTLDINDRLLTKARRKAIEQKTTLTAIIEEALRRSLMPLPRPTRSLASRWVIVKGERPPAVDIADRDRLYDALEGRRP